MSRRMMSPRSERWQPMILTDTPLSSHRGGRVRTHQGDENTTPDEKRAEGMTDQQEVTVWFVR